MFDWQEPNNTEKLAFDNLIKYFMNKYIDDDISYYAYPWANIIEYAQQEKMELYKFVTTYIKTHKNCNKLSVTTFQSYKIWNYINDFKMLDINVVFSPHAERKLSHKVFLEDGILILPMFLVPIITPNHKIHDQNNNATNLKFMCSFLGNINYGDKPCTYLRKYMCETVKNIDNVLIETTNEWHLDNKIYGKELQLKKYEKSKEIIQQKNEDKYFYAMNSSTYSLCPIGIGPNSFRISETIMFEKYPIIIADNLWLPEIRGLNMSDWAFIIEENKINDVNEYINIFNTSENILEIKKKNINVVKKYLEDISNPISEYLTSKFTLLTVMYNVKNSERLNEYKHVFNRNIRNKYIEKIVIFYELLEDEKPFIYDFLLHDKIEIIFLNKKMPREISFNEMMNYCNEKLYGKLCIISNNDIYYDDSLQKIKKINLVKNRDILAITRENFFEFKIKKNNTIWKKNEGSQDTWIFSSPIKLFKPIIKIGWIASDNRIAYELEKLGYNVYNPTHDIKCIHYQHQDQNTNLTKFSHRGDGPIKFLELDYLNNNTNVNLEFYEEIENEKLDTLSIKNKLNCRAVKQYYNDKKLKQIIETNVVCYFSENYPDITSGSILCQKILYSVPNMIYFNIKQTNEIDKYLNSVKNPLIITNVICQNLLQFKYPIVFLCDEQTLNQLDIDILKSILKLKIIFLSYNCLMMFDDLYKINLNEINYDVLNIGSDLNIALKKKENNDDIINILGEFKNKNISKKIKKQSNNIQFKNLVVPDVNENYYDYIHKKEEIFLQSNVFCQLKTPNIHLVLDSFILGTPVIVPDDKTFYGDIPNECIIKIPVNKIYDAEYIFDKIKYALKNEKKITQNAFGWYLNNSSFDKWNNKFKEILTVYHKHCYVQNNVSIIEC